MSIDRSALPLDRIAEFCRRWKVREFALFGSALRSDFRADSDVDVMLTFADDADWGLFDLARMRAELAEVFGREVDVLTRPGVEGSRNRLRREAILSSAEVVYAT